MRRVDRRLRVFALIWAVLQFALPASASLADAQLSRGAADGAHVEAGPGRDCAPSHSLDCAVCKHLSSTSLRAANVVAAFAGDDRGRAPLRRAAAPYRAPAGVSFARAPPAQS
jgi:hypothetical protein